jgi:hypothetical protein
VATTAGAGGETRAAARRDRYAAASDVGGRVPVPAPRTSACAASDLPLLRLLKRPAGRRWLAASAAAHPLVPALPTHPTTRDPSGERMFRSVGLAGCPCAQEAFAWLYHCVAEMQRVCGITPC